MWMMTVMVGIDGEDRDNYVGIVGNSMDNGLVIADRNVHSVNEDEYQCRQVNNNVLINVSNVNVDAACCGYMGSCGCSGG